MKTSPSTAVVVLGYRALGSLVRGSMASILAASARLPGETHVIYLDNYSRDGSVQWVLEHCQDIDVLLAPTNTLYCNGVNTLLQYAAYRYRPDYYLLADADNFVDADCIARLVEFLDHSPGHGMAQPLVKSVSDPATIYSSGHWFTPDHWCLPRKDIADKEVLLDLPSCSISSTIIRSSVLERCGLLDPIFEIYYESADLSFRARAAGFRCACVVGAVAQNEGTDASGLDSMHHRYYFNRNRLIFWGLHDAGVYQTVADESRRRLAEFDAALAASEFGLGAADATVRLGLMSGLEVSGRPDLRSRPPVALGAFDKAKAVLLATGAAL